MIQYKIYLKVGNEVSKQEIFSTQSDIPLLEGQEITDTSSRKTYKIESVNHSTEKIQNKLTHNLIVSFIR